MDHAYYIEQLRLADAEITRAILCSPPARKLTTAQALLSVLTVAGHRVMACQSDPATRNGEMAQRWSGIRMLVNDAIITLAGPSGKFYAGRNCVQIDGRADPAALCIGWLEGIRDPYNALGSVAWSIADALRILRTMGPRPDPMNAPLGGMWMGR